MQRFAFNQFLVACSVMASLPGAAFPQESRPADTVTNSPTGRANMHGRVVNKFGVAQAPPRAQGTIRIATYNMLNFFDQVNDPGLEGEFDDLPMATSEARCRELARGNPGD